MFYVLGKKIWCEKNPSFIFAYVLFLWWTFQQYLIFLWENTTMWDLLMYESLMCVNKVPRLLESKWDFLMCEILIWEILLDVVPSDLKISYTLLKWCRIYFLYSWWPSVISKLQIKEHIETSSHDIKQGGWQSIIPVAARVCVFVQLPLGVLGLWVVWCGSVRKETSPGHVSSLYHLNMDLSEIKLCHPEWI